MTKQPIFISSRNRETAGLSRPDDFTIQFTPPLNLPKDRNHYLALDKIHLVYSWYNITQAFGNNTIKYSHDAGNTWTTITFTNGTYSYSDLNDYIKHAVFGNGHQQLLDNKIRLTFINSTFRVLLELEDGFQIDLRGSKFNILIGFDQELVTATKYGDNIPDITNAIDSLHIKTDLVTESIVDGLLTDTLYIVDLENYVRGHPITLEPLDKQYVKLSSTYIPRARFRIVDDLNRPVDLNGINWRMILSLKTEL